MASKPAMDGKPEQQVRRTRKRNKQEEQANATRKNNPEQQ